MKHARPLLSCSALLALSALAPACSPDDSGQLMLAVQTDMSLPKDVDAIRIEVFNEGVPKFRKDYERLGTVDGEIRLPGTLALLAPEKADSAVTVSVSARVGGPSGKVRVMRQVVTTVPTDRVASLQIPLRFVCDGSGEDMNGEAVSTCPEGQTCIAGSCVDRTLDSSTLPTYEEDDVFSSGSCFDAATCWDLPTRVDVDPSDCSIPFASDINVALEVEGDGICGPAGCFVTLDAENDDGWQERDGRIALPPAVCEKLGTGAIVSVATSQITASCAKKTLALPTCGPWSTAENHPAYEGPRALAGGQERPLGVTIANGRVYFTNSNDGDAPGAIKVVGLEGGKVTAIPLPQGTAPRDLVTAGNKVFFTSAPGNPEGGAIFVIEQGNATAIQTKLGAPEGITVRGNKIFWTDFQSGDVYQALDGQIGQRKRLASMPGHYPYRIAADDTHVYVVNEGTAAESDGMLVRISHTTAEPVVETLIENLRTPRALALELDPSSKAKAVYFATFSDTGTIERLTFSSGEPVHEILATGLDHPNGIALDVSAIYWTNWGNGTVNALSKAIKKGDLPRLLSEGRVAPGAIAVTDTAIFWTDEGSSSKPTGTLVKLPKPTL